MPWPTKKKSVSQGQKNPLYRHRPGQPGSAGAWFAEDSDVWKYQRKYCQTPSPHYSRFTRRRQFRINGWLQHGTGSRLPPANIATGKHCTYHLYRPQHGRVYYPCLCGKIPPIGSGPSACFIQRPTPITTKERPTGNAPSNSSARMAATNT